MVVRLLKREGGDEVLVERAVRAEVVGAIIVCVDIDGREVARYSDDHYLVQYQSMW